MTKEMGKNAQKNAGKSAGKSANRGVGIWRNFSKLIFPVLTVSLFVSTSQATPKVGDRIVMKMEIRSGTELFETKTESVEILRFDEEYQKFVIRTSLPIEGRGLIGVNEGWVSPTDLPSSELLQDLVKNCAQKRGGTQEELEINGTKIMTCHVVEADGTEVWLADVLHGAVQVIRQIEEGYIETMTVVEFEKGQ